MSSKKLGGLRPDLTLAQLVGLAAGAVPIVTQLLVAFGGYHPTPEQGDALNAATHWLVGGAGALFVSDAAIRVGRNAKDGKVEAAALAKDSAAPGVMLTPLRTVGEPIEGQLDVFKHEDSELAGQPEGLPSDDEEFASGPPEERAGDVRPDGESPSGDVTER